MLHNDWQICVMSHSKLELLQQMFLSTCSPLIYEKVPLYEPHLHMIIFQLWLRTEYLALS